MSESTEGSGAGLACVVVYSRENCCLCDEALAEVERARKSAGFELQILDVDTDPELAARYGHEVPVVVVNGRKAFKFRLSAEQLLRQLRRARP